MPDFVSLPANQPKRDRGVVLLTPRKALLSFLAKKGGLRWRLNDCWCLVWLFSESL